MVFRSVAAASGRAQAPARAAMVMLGLALGPALLGHAVAEAAPDAAKVRTAAEEFDEAVRLYKAKDYGAAAGHFEAADAAVPSPKALRLAIRSRTEAGQLGRALSLSAYALHRYPEEKETAETAKETLEAHRAAVQEVKVSCVSLCLLAVQIPGEAPRSVHGDANTRWTLYLEPGSSVVSASFLGGIPAGDRTIEAKAGGSSALRFDAKGEATPPPATGAEAPAPPPPVTTPPDEPESDGGGISPIFFLGGAVLTAAAAGVTVWSGIDTMNEPGEDAVRAGCVGQGTECSLYQDGLAKETRTNVLIGVTAGLGATTLVLAILTDWDGDPEASATTGAARQHHRRLGPLRFAPPGVAATPEGAALSASGRF